MRPWRRKTRRSVILAHFWILEARPKVTNQAHCEADEPPALRCPVAGAAPQSDALALNLGRRIGLPRIPLRQVGLQARQGVFLCGGGKRDDSLRRFA